MENSMESGRAVSRFRAAMVPFGLILLSGCGSGENGSPSASDGPIKEDDIGTEQEALTAQRHDWHRGMLKKDLPGKGCYRAVHPSTDWEEVECVDVPEGMYRPAMGAAAATGNTFNVGGGFDYMGQSVKTISTAVGSFPSVTGVTGEKGTNGIANSYSLQMNTDFFQTSTCNGATVPANCRGWVQFIYGSTSSVVFIEEWLLNYGVFGGTPNCPPGGQWKADMRKAKPTDTNLTFFGNCVLDNQGMKVTPQQSVTNLKNMVLTGQAVLGGNDKVTLFTGTNTISAVGVDSILNLSLGWRGAEFNIFGDGAGSPNAIFTDTGAPIAVTVRTALTGPTAAPTCVRGGTTAETNSLNLILSSCCATAGANPTVSFIQGNVPSTRVPFCLLNEVSPIQLPLL